MASGPGASFNRIQMRLIWCSLAFQLLRIVLQRGWPDSLAADFAMYANSAFILAWLGYTVWTGYQRRKPYWTRESWRRYLRLTAMPVIVLVLVLGEIYLFDARLYDANLFRSVFGPAQSAQRLAWILVDVILGVLGTIGVMNAIDWMLRGEPSEQFTRTQWFRQRSESA